MVPSSSSCCSRWFLAFEAKLISGVVMVVIRWGRGNQEDVGYSTLGARVATYYLLQNGMALIPRASVAWQHAFGDVTPTAALSFQSTGSGFNVLGVPIARDAALVEAGGDLQLTAQAKIGVSYAGQLANSAHDHSVKGNFTWRF